MPIYEYKCNNCNKTFELLVRSEVKPVCPDCKSDNLKKLVSSFSAVSQTNSKQQQKCPYDNNNTCCCSGGCNCG